jgi:RNA polymerase sigma-70 factor (ECF subfamily)
VHREEWGRIVATLIRVTGDWDLVEDAVQTAFEKAATRWPRDGVPDSPGAWLTTVARNTALDVLRRRATEERSRREVAFMSAARDESSDPGTILARDWDDDADDRLRLLFACAHPALAREARVALTLHAVAGLTTREIAHAFLVSETTMAQRLVRAKRRIRGAGIPFRVPAAEELPERLDGVLAVLYLVYSEGYAASGGEDMLRVDLAAEAIRVVRLVIELVGPHEGDEARALLALMLLDHSRRAARVDVNGDLVPLEEQDRSRWDSSLIEEARGLLDEEYGARGGYRVQAELAAEHAFAPSADATDWTRIHALYVELTTFTDSPMARLSRAISRAFAEGLRDGLDDLDGLEASGELTGSHLLPAARADLLRRLGDQAGALQAYQRARELAPTAAERRFLGRRIEELRAD